MDKIYDMDEKGIFMRKWGDDENKVYSWGNEIKKNLERIFNFNEEWLVSVIFNWCESKGYSENTDELIYLKDIASFISGYSFYDGAQIDDAEIYSFHQEILRELIPDDSPETVTRTIATGNGLVVGIKHKDGHIEIYECKKGYKHINYAPTKIDKINL